MFGYGANKDDARRAYELFLPTQKTYEKSPDRCTKLLFNVYKQRLDALLFDNKVLEQIVMTSEKGTDPIVMTSEKRSDPIVMT